MQIGKGTVDGFEPLLLSRLLPEHEPRLAVPDDIAQQDTVLNLLGGAVLEIRDGDARHVVLENGVVHRRLGNEVVAVKHEIFQRCAVGQSDFIHQITLLYALMLNAGRTPEE